MSSDVHILLVNSNPQARAVLKNTLTKAGYTHISEAENGREAVKILGQDAIKLLITDIEIAPLDGWRLGRMVRAGIFKCEDTIPLIVVASTWCERIAETTAKVFGFNKVIPFEKHGMLPQAVRNSLRDPGSAYHKPRVLIVEDFPDTAFLAKRILAQRFEIEIATDGQAGLDSWRQHRHELVLLDVMLPKLSGREVLQEILKIHQFQPVVIMTAHSTIELAEELMLEGAADFIAKPFMAEPLRRVIEIALKREDYLISNAQFAARVQSLNESKDAHHKISQGHQHLLDSLGTVILKLDEKGRLLFLNKEWERLTGYSITDSLGKHLSDFRYRSDHAEWKTFQHRLDAFRIGELRDCSLELPLANKKGQPLWAKCRLEAMYSEDGRQSVSGCLENVTKCKRAEELLQKAHDELEDRVRERTKKFEKTNELLRREVNERIRAEEELEKARYAAEEASQAKSQFLANMSHEIRTPINGILGMAEIALDTDLDEDQRQLLRTIFSEANSLLAIISDVLDLSKVEAGKLELESIPFDLRNLIEDLATSMGFRAQQKGLDFVSFMAPQIPSKLFGDPVRLRQILLNLCSNALKFTSAGEVVLMVEKQKDQGDNITLRFLVKDTGIGIPKEKQALIFESFCQADSTTTRKYGGTGLGTTIAKQLTEMMGGQIGLESEEGKGTTFWFTLEFPKQEEQAPPLPGQDIDLQGVRVLLVNDNRSNRLALTEYLQAWGCLTTELPFNSKTGTMLLECADQHDSFDLIVTDFQTLEMGEFGLIESLRSHDLLSQVPIVALTSIGKKGDGEKCRKIGIDCYLTKPIKHDDLRRAIGMTLEKMAGGDPQKRPTLITRHFLSDESRKDIRILLAEDYPTNQQVAIKHLEGAGYHVTLAENGQIAVDNFKRKQFNLILMDIDMPVMNGYEATSAIRALEQKANSLTRSVDATTKTRVPVVAMTAHAKSGDRETCLATGMDDYISKPLRRSDLLALVEKWALPRSAASQQSDPKAESATACGSCTSMDYDKAVEEFQGDEAFLRKVLLGFFENVDKQAVRIRQAIADDDSETVRREAHAIKGGAANLLAIPLSEAARQLEELGNSAELSSIPAVFEKLLWELNRLRDEMETRENLTA